MTKNIKKSKQFVFLPVYVVLIVIVTYLTFSNFPSVRNSDTSNASSNNIYVSITGRDTNGGTQTSPFRSIQKAVDSAVPGTTIYVSDGTYNERVTINRSGTAAAPITLRAQSDKVVIDGGDRSTNWRKASQYGPNIYELSGHGYEVGNLNWNGNYILEYKKANMSSTALKTDFITGPEDSWQAIDALFGTYEGKVYLGFGSTQNPNSLDISYAPRLVGGITISSAAHIIVENFTVKNSYFGILLTNNTNNTIIRKNTFSGNTFGVGLWNGARNNAVHHNAFTLNYKHTLSPYAQYSNLLWNAFKVTSTGDRVAIDCYRGGAQNTIHSNAIKEHFGGVYTGRGGVNYCTQFTVHNNYIENILDDGLEPEANITNSHWYNNTVINAKQGIRIKEPIGGPLYVYNNKFVSSQNRGIYYVASNDARVFVYHNSIIRTPTKSLVASAISGGNLANSLFVNNLLIGDEFGQTSNGGASVIFYNNGVVVKSGTPRISSTNKIITDQNINAKYSINTTQLTEMNGVGIDISKPFIVNGKSYQPLPGFTGPYFQEARPTVGAYSVTDIPQQTPKPTQTPRPTVTIAPQTSSPNPETSAIQAELWQNLNTTLPATVTNLTEDSRYPMFPSRKLMLRSLDTPHQLGDAYGIKVKGYIRPPVSGEYTFVISGDDEAQFWLSTNEEERNERLISSTQGWTAPQEWNKYPSQKSNKIMLATGKAYYFEMYMVESKYADHGSVWWIKPGDSYPTPINAEFISKTLPEVLISSKMTVRAKGTQANNEYAAFVVEHPQSGFVSPSFYTSSTYANYSVDLPSSLRIDDLLIRYINDGTHRTNTGVLQDRNLSVEYIQLSGITYKTEDADTFSSGTWISGTGCTSGYLGKTDLHCGGYFKFR